MHGCNILRMLTLLTAANGAPVVLARARRSRAVPVDGGRTWIDGRPVFGSSKTVRGVSLAVAATALAGRAFGLPLRVGTWIGSVAMLGDLTSSFVKRRLGLPPSSRAIGLDQIPEALLPAATVRRRLSLTRGEMLASVAMFLAADLFLSGPLYRAGLRKQPY